MVSAPEFLGNVLKQREEPYVVNRDVYGTWRILNTWHPGLNEFDYEAEIGDDHPAVCVVTEGAFLALMKEAVIQGYNLSGDVGENSFDGDNNELEKENETLKWEIDLLKEEMGKMIDAVKEEEEKQIVQSEKYLFHKEKFAVINKLIAIRGTISPEEIRSITSIGGNEDIV